MQDQPLPSFLELKELGVHLANDKVFKDEFLPSFESNVSISLSFSTENPGSGVPKIAESFLRSWSASVVSENGGQLVPSVASWEEEVERGGGGGWMLLRREAGFDLPLLA